uniref:Uncharacterized protein n=1 Tax=Tanacetum cinerariifolium TaxID=118510 RepID=A0A6L2LN82_TANCI|nr:hypothetical protein [Tanacetum cinerariifolium]
MVEEKHEQQQNMLDTELVPINEQVKIEISNFMIALEKTQLDVIYNVFKVNADLLHNALSITPKDLDHPFTLPVPENEIIKFINKLGCSKTIRTISALIVNDMYQPSRTFLTINKCSNIDFAKLIWEDLNTKLSLERNMKFTNKGTKYLLFGMSIPAMMLNDDIKASAEYSEYLVKSKGSEPVKANDETKVCLLRKE